jgi:uncharacterized membrane protein
MRPVAFALVCVLSIAVAGYALFAYSVRPLGASVHPDMRAEFNARPLAVYTHIFASAVALLLGPWQFLASARAAWPRLHRVLGRLYLVGVAVGGAAGLVIAFFAFGGAVSTAGFGLLAVLWLLTGVRAFQTARRRDFAAHRRWMVRNFALTLAAVTIRIGLGVGFASGLPFEVFYPALTWLCWVPNLAIAEMLIRQQPAEGTGAAAAAPVGVINSGNGRS